MLQHYLKQALQMLKENPLVNTISILGTALSIAMILTLVLVFQINNAGYAPESHRSRMLYVYGTEVSCPNNTNRGQMSAEVVRECFYTLQTPEAVSARVRTERPVSLPGKRLFTEYTILYTDTGFWRIFDFRFIKGGPFTGADFESGIPRAVITDEAARRLTGSVDAVGRRIVFENITYVICGVAGQVSKAARHASADIWAPYTSKAGLMEQDASYENMTGRFGVVMLAANRSDFDSIKAELEKQTNAYNTAKQDCKVGFMNNPVTQLDIATGSGAFRKASLKDYLANTGSVVLFLLLIPAINLVGVVLSSVKKRRSEIGLRKAFGATRAVIVRQILAENMVFTGIGALMGLGLSFLLLYLSRSFMLDGEVALTAGMLFKPGLFAAVLFFAFLLNLLSAGLPALHITRLQIVEALNDTNK
ncbi:MAG: ABC transporter permease [Tannerellaceae bacterium]|jgi:putative ABC transport system permease protein|nr:ABC transporter permease [Tannerellaceae bacterium]